jgi:hypothetical protein
VTDVRKKPTERACSLTRELCPGLTNQTTTREHKS